MFYCYSSLFLTLGQHLAVSFLDLHNENRRNKRLVVQDWEMTGLTRALVHTLRNRMHSKSFALLAWSSNDDELSQIVDNQL